MKTFMIERQTKTAPSWSFILMLLMTTDQFSEFDRICVDQGLDLVLEGRAIFRGMPSNSSVVLTSGINIVFFQIWRSSWSSRNDRNPIVLDQYGEQFSIGHRKCMVHFGLFPFLALVIAWVRPLIIFSCKLLGRKNLIGGTWVHEVQVYSFNANADIKVKFTFFKKFIRKWKHSRSKDKQKLPLVDPSS